MYSRHGIQPPWVRASLALSPSQPAAAGPGRLRPRGRHRRLLLGLLQPGDDTGIEAEPLSIGGVSLDPARVDAVVRIDENSGELQAILGLDPCSRGQRDHPRPRGITGDGRALGRGAARAGRGAAADFLRLDHHVKAQDWLRVHLAPARPRITAGRSLPLANLRMTTDKTIVGTIELRPGHGEAELEALSSRFSKGEGDFVGLLPRPEAEGEGPSWYDLIYRGKTCVIERMDWRKGEVELAVIPSSSKGGPDPYILPSFGFRPDSEDGKDHPFARATLDESLSDFVAGRVERRLGSKRGRHALRWFDPVEPRIPERGPIEPGQRQRLSDFLSGLGFGPERAHRLEADRVEAILGGIEARVQLIQGPPGTGKTTTTSLALLARLLAGAARSGEIVMIAANTHTAIDTLLDRIRGYYSDFAKQAHEAGLRMSKLGMRKVTSGDDLEPTTGGVPTLKAAPRELGRRGPLGRDLAGRSPRGDGGQCSGRTRASRGHAYPVSSSRSS